MVIYHLAPADRWHAWPESQPYLPSAYDADGFIHCTAGAALMVQVANLYYRNTPGMFVVLALDPQRLSAPLRWERSADTFNTDFPHIYGPINREAVVAVYEMPRAADGTFLAWTG